MRRTFNGGIGFVFVVPRADESRALAVLARLGESSIRMGQVIEMPSSTPFEERLVWPERGG
jgi:phosphoribosylaminoimidazole (AIR) synthetase